MRQSCRVYRAAAAAVVLLSLVLLADVASGLIAPRQPPTADEGAQAHIFQISAALMIPALLAASLTTRSVRAAWPLALGIASLVMSFAAVYAIEHP